MTIDRKRSGYRYLSATQAIGAVGGDSFTTATGANLIGNWVKQFNIYQRNESHSQITDIS
jgi:hypothetical protein